MVTPALLDAYLATHYEVKHAASAFTLHIGQSSAELLALLQKTGLTGAAFITAWNPHSKPHLQAENRRAQQRLLEDLQQAGCMVIPAAGVDPDSQWPGEESVLALGLAQADAVQLSRKYSQNAIVWADADAVPQLLFCY
ncbi:MAG: DUF3293 domain-containing protein [Gammaproteobacteria bacterium]|nr:DUF3293 domain-containing protein [Gammaproteobacteria bacterium]MBU1724656.1 DUF3293 domain-containing protein [Gammaproteobacteria bacterium]MBU2005884.1 DUF3293 domain-containing protein [Gammaproteobacteria bacterium]